MIEPTPIDTLLLSTRTHNGLVRAGIQNLQELVSYEAHELLAIRGFGTTSLEEVRAQMNAHGLCLLGERVPPKEELEQLSEQQSRFIQSASAFLCDLSHEPDATAQETLHALELIQSSLRRSRPGGKVSSLVLAAFDTNICLSERRRYMTAFTPSQP